MRGHSFPPCGTLQMALRALLRERSSMGVPCTDDSSLVVEEKASHLPIVGKRFNDGKWRFS